MRFRLIEKDTVGTGTEFVQNDKKKLAHSKTYIPKVRSNKVDMNKIKNTKIGDDIHYYINGVEGRGIVVKMANEYLEVFKENGQLGTIHINDTFFVKDILVNKQWNDMDDQERYEALDKIHAPTPRFIMKAWEQLPEEIKILLRNSNKTINKVGSTYEEGESKPSETSDHARTGFAQNEQFSKPKGCKCGDPKCKDPKCKKGKEVEKAKTPRWVDPETGEEDWSEHSYRYDREAATEKHKDTMKPEEHIGHPDYFNKEKNPFWNKRVATDPNKLDSKGVAYGKGHHKVYHPDDPVSDHTRRKKDKNGKPYSDNFTHAGHEAKLRSRRKNQQNVHTGEADFEAKHQAYKTRRSGYDKAKKVVTDAQDKQQKNLTDQWAKDHPEKKEDPKTKPTPKKDEYGREIKPAESGTSGGFILDTDDPDDISNKSHNKAYQVWLERREKSEVLQKDSVDGEQSKDGKPDTSEYASWACPVCGKQEHGREDFEHHQLTHAGTETGRRGTSFDGGKFTPEESRDRSPAETKKSDVEHGVYGNVAGSDGVGVSTDTKVDVAEDTGYEERPHISVEEAGKLPRTTFNESGSELTVTGSQDSKDKPKFSQPHSQETVRKVGLPEQHPNTYGVRYGMKGGVKKVWCPEHQMWEETRKDWHE